MTFHRRRFLSIAACAAALAGQKAAALQQQADVRIGSQVRATMPPNFTGLSYESPQLYNPNYFSSHNTELVAAFKRLSRNGVLRFGGNLSDVARWKSEAGDFSTPKQTAAIEHGKTNWEWKLTDSTVRDHRDGAITPLSLARLRGFLDATNWKAIYGLNFGSGSPERARDETAHVACALGDRLIAFQVGNEAEFYGDNPFYREKSYDFEEYYAGYRGFVAAVRQAVPQAPFAGPDTAYKMDWVEAFAKREGKDAIMLTSHFYAMGPAKDPAMNAERLLSGKSSLTEQIAEAHKATADSGGVPFRLTETNSCYGGGKPDVSDAFASALWGADMMLETAQAGYAGVNLHGGGDGYYTPIAVTVGGGAELRPLAYGMRLAGIFAGADLLECESVTDANVKAYAARHGGRKLLALINKGPETVSVSFNWNRPTRMIRMTAPALDSKSGVSLRPAALRAGRADSISGYSATMLIWD